MMEAEKNYSWFVMVYEFFSTRCVLPRLGHNSLDKNYISSQTLRDSIYIELCDKLFLLLNILPSNLPFKSSFVHINLIENNFNTLSCTAFCQVLNHIPQGNRSAGFFLNIVKIFLIVVNRYQYLVYYVTKNVLFYKNYLNLLWQINYLSNRTLKVHK